ncbi:unnamed protein product [Darwinula stevensoni]|uniref:Nidogen-1 n=1 Tax=Darwinula stevensoni TaxID=69355 RepID=A0A7R9AEV5_9CRUS|nr:unnamed protein product [Darwinula stevensoni]CAG0901758.1 unnamed protein product [Darwinula stevensoni]
MKSKAIEPLFLVTLLLHSVAKSSGIRDDFLLPFGLQHGDQSLLREVDDFGSREIPLTTPIVFYGHIYQSLYVNANGILSFLTEIPSFFNVQFPLDYPIIAPLYTDVDTRASGSVFFRESKEPGLLDRVERDVKRFFSKGTGFRPQSLIIVTWNRVGYFNAKSNKVNTYQTVVATDGRDTFAFFLYPSGGIEWIQGEGKNKPMPDARAQAGLISGDGRMYTLRGSGTDQVKNLDKWSNTGTAGYWAFHVGRTGLIDNVMLPDLVSPQSETQPFPPFSSQSVKRIPLATAERPSEADNCVLGATFCHSEARCVDHFPGFCCECRIATYGNGRFCLEYGEPLRMIGKVSGAVNGKSFQNEDFHGYVVSSEGRVYTAISKIPVEIGADLQSLNVIGTLVAWIFAMPRNGALNGYQITGGIFNQSATVEFPQTGHRIAMNHRYEGIDVFDHVRLNMNISGTLPTIPREKGIEIDDYNEEYVHRERGVLEGNSRYKFRLEGEELETEVVVRQTIRFEACPYGPARPPMGQTLALNVHRNFIIFDEKEQIVRYGCTAKITPSGVDISRCRHRETRAFAWTSTNAKSGETTATPTPPASINPDPSSANADPVSPATDELVPVGLHYFDTRFHRIDNVPNSPLLSFLSDFQEFLTCKDLECGLNAECVEVPGVEAACRCSLGFQGDGYVCRRWPGSEVLPVEGESVSEQTSGSLSCATEETICDPFASCIYDFSSKDYKCRCRDGYVGDGIVCIQREEVPCNVADNCSPSAVCTLDMERLGERIYVCICLPGYVGDGYTCTAEDECLTSIGCHQHAECVYDPSSFKYRCQCKYGFEGNGKNCTPSEEAGCNIIDRCDLNAECRYDAVALNYHCQCNEGYVGDGYKCELSRLGCNIHKDCAEHAECIYDLRSQGYRCTCQEGFKGDGYTCLPSQTCYENPAVCHKNAVCVPGARGESYECRCTERYKGDGYSCTESPRLESGFLLVGQGISILRIPLDASPFNPGRPIIINPLQTAVGLSSPEGLAVDWLSKLIYWTDSTKDTIEFTSIESGRRRTLHSENLVNPRGIALHPGRGQVYWSDWDRQDPRIERSAMNGEDRSVVVRENLALPNALAVDYEYEDLCWTDAGTQLIKCHNLNDGRTRLIGESPYPFGLTQMQGSFFWTDWKRKAILRAPKLGLLDPIQMQVPFGGAGAFYDLVAVPDTCPAMTTACQYGNGGCDTHQICVPNTRGDRSCLCGDTPRDGDPVCGDLY